MTASSAADVARLAALVSRQRRELDRIRSQAAMRSVVDIAQGVLMERLGCSVAEAGEQLTRLAHESGTPLADLAAELTGRHLEQQWRAETEPPSPAGTGPHGAEPGWDRLSRASAALQHAVDGDAIAAAALSEVLAPDGAAALALWLLGPDGGLDLAGQAGLSPGEAARWRHLPPAMDCLPQRVARTGIDVHWPRGRPRGETVQVPCPEIAGARVALAMRGHGEIVGVLAACWPGKFQSFPAGLLRQFSALADLCARALSVRAAAAGPDAPVEPLWLYGLLDGLAESVLVAFPVRDADGSVTDFQIRYVSTGFRDPAGRPGSDLTGQALLEVFPLAALPGGLFDHAAAVAESGAARQVSGRVVSALVGDSSVMPVLDIRIAPLFDGVVVTWRSLDEAERLASLLEHAERLGRIGGWEENLFTGEIRWTDSAFALFGRSPGDAIRLSDLEGHVVPDDLVSVEQFRHTLLEEKRATAAAFRVIRADDESVRQMRVFAEPVADPAGPLIAVRGAFQDVSSHYHTQVALTATRDRLADTEERAEEEHRLAMRLQEAITPWSSEPVSAAGLEIAARYRPAGPAGLVSGDWYDAVLLPTGQVLLAVGDIAGHGIDAVTGMVELRNCLRGLAITGASPASLLKWLNEVACHLTDGIIGTAVCGLYDPARQALRWARAGHLAPVLVRDGEATHLPLPVGLMLGADPAVGYQELTTQLCQGDVLLMFTDGLVERRDLAIDEALTALLHHATRPVTGISGYADYLLDHAGSNTGDDACLVTVHVR